MSRTSSPTKSPFHEGVHFSTLHEVAFISVIGLAQLLTQASLGQVVLPLEIIGASLGTTDPGQLSWLVAAYSLTVGTFVLPAGRLGDMYGHKKLVMIGYAWFALWSFVAGFAGFAHSLVMFAICRALQGIAPAAILVNSVAILGRTYVPGPRKNYAFAIFAACAPNGFVVGALFATIFAQFAWWPWAFWVEAIACALIVLLAYYTLPPDDILTESPASSTASQPSSHGFDYLGTILGVTGLVLVNIAWNQAPIVGWPTVYVYVLLLVGILLLAAFVWVEGRVAAPLVPRDVWNRPITLMLLCIVLGWAAFGIWNFYGVRFLINFRGYTRLEVVAQFVVGGIAGAMATGVTGFLLPRVGPSVVMVLALCAFCIALILYAFAPVHQTFWGMTFVTLVIAPFGMDMSFPAASLVASNAVPRHQQGTAASLVNTFVNYAISLGLGFAGTVESQTNNGGKTPGDVLKGYRAAWYLGIGLSGLGVGVALLNLWMDIVASKRVQTDEKRDDVRDEKTEVKGAATVDEENGETQQHRPFREDIGSEEVQG